MKISSFVLEELCPAVFGSIV